MNRNGLSTDPWCIPTAFTNSLNVPAVDFTFVWVPIYSDMIASATSDARNEVPWELVNVCKSLGSDGWIGAESAGGFWEVERGVRKRMTESNLEKTNVKVTQGEKRHRSGRQSCGWCGWRVGVNLILDLECNKWCHWRCSGLRRANGVQNFYSPAYRQKIDIDDVRGSMTTERRIELHEFCCLGETLDCETGVERTVRVRAAATRKNWKRWRAFC